MQIDKEGPAAKSDLRVGDVIVAVNGKTIDDSVDMPLMIGNMTPGSTAKLDIIRDGKKMTISVKVEEADSSAPAKGKAAASNASTLGVTVRTLSSEEQDKVGTEGLLVVKSQGAARKAGIVEGDIIVNVNGTAIKTVNDLGKVIEKNAGKTLRVLVQRRDGRIFIPVKIK